jgi:serine/threonine protein kinase
MTPERFRQIEELYHVAREGTAKERAVLLAETDPELRREVELLLSQPTGGEFLDRPAIQNAPQLLDDSTVTNLAAGACLGPYRIESKLGEGGMGEVFRAIDTRLGRAVAIKVTHEQFGARFEREARAISSLNHPYICTLHDVGPNYLVMELVEGETIAVRLKSGPLPVKTALRYASQIMAALVEAHGKGIVHRDLKPANIMIAKSGVKVLDFGLAKSGQDETVTASHVVMGTPAYMAPEQREGKPADARSDIYSFGCVLHEMVTGVRPASQRKRIPSRRLEKIVSRCLEEDPARRWQSAAVLERELAAITAGATQWKRIIPAAAAALALFAAADMYLHRSPRLTDKDTIVLADFENKTGDPVFDDTLRQGLSVELQQSPFLTLISDERIQQTLGLMGQRKDTRLTAEIARQICERTASAAVLEGSIASLGSQYVLGLRATSCNTGNTLDQEQIHAARREDVLDSLSQIARKFRIRVGESLATVEKHSVPLEDATTPSLEALKAYSMALHADVSSGPAAAVPLLRKAVEIDPKFAVAHALSGLVYSNMGESVLSAESAARAWQLRDRASDRERFFIDFNYYREVTGNLEKAFQTLESWAQTYPRGADPDPRDLMTGLSAIGTGRFERVIEQSKKTIASRPDVFVGYLSLVHGNFFLDRFGEAEDALRLASVRKVEIPAFLVYRYNIAFLKGDQAQMNQAVALAKGKHGAEHWITHSQAMVMARSGRLKEARVFSSRAIDLARQEGTLEAAATYQAAAAEWEALYGNAAEARRNALAALALSKGRDVEYAAALALELSGELSRSQALAAGLEKRFPEDTFARFTYVPVLRALSSLDRGHPADSIDQLQTALQYELAANGLSRNLYLGGLHSAYVRGEAFVAAHRYAEAAAEFQKILDHRGIVGADPIGALAHLQLGRTFALAGDKSRAMTAYQDFFTHWKDADGGIPILKQAKVDYDKLL